MVQRQMIEIDEEKCTGCAKCIPNCPEGALQIIDGKARLVSDLFCDGLGACVGHCPEDAMHVIEREAEPYDENIVMANIVKQGAHVIEAHLKHLKDHGADDYYNDAITYLDKNNIDIPKIEEKPLPCGCPGSAMREIKKEDSNPTPNAQNSELTQWPIQLNLLPPQAPFFKDAHLLIAADCTAFAYPNFHSGLLHGKKLMIGCPKFDDVGAYTEKLVQVFQTNNIKSVTVAIMEVPCCRSLLNAVQSAISESGKDIPLITEIVKISGELQ